MSQRRENRIAAMQFLYAWEIERPPHLAAALQGFFENTARWSDPEDGDEVAEKPRAYWSFAEELAAGVIEKLPQLDERIRGYAKNWEFKRIARIDLAILRLALYELDYRLDIPPVVTINEAIELAKLYSASDAKRFINGILDQHKLTLKRPLREAT